MALRERSFDSIESAVVEAKRLQLEEGYDLFRGQRRPWALRSSFDRLADGLQQKAMARLNEFLFWAKNEPALLPYAFSSDQALAVAQHYGIPTSFIDFTTDINVARHFASEPATEADSPGMSCIIALHSEQLTEWLAQRFERTGAFLGPEVLRIDVANLWRLEAQAGVFLVYDELLDGYPFDYLVFPSSSVSGESWKSSTVYPEERSDLELIVEQWFLHVKAGDGTKELHEMFKQAGLNLTVVNGGPTDGIGLNGITRPTNDPSWSGREECWVRKPELFADARPRSSDVVEIPLRSGMNRDDARELVAERIPPASIAERRARSAEWRILVDGQIHAEASGKFKRQWDALRIDGYSDAQVFESLAASTSLALLNLGLIPDQPACTDFSKRGPLEESFGFDLLVEFCGLVGYGRAQICATDLRAAVREDIDRYLPADLYEYTGPTPAERMTQLLIGIHRPNLLFDFDRFADVYVRQVIPTSIIFRPDLPLYPVLQLTTFGTP